MSNSGGQTKARDLKFGEWIVDSIYWKPLSQAKQMPTTDNIRGACYNAISRKAYAAYRKYRADSKRSN